jgi:hypothetical protein
MGASSSAGVYNVVKPSGGRSGARRHSGRCTPSRRGERNGILGIVNHGDPTEGMVGADGTRRRLQGLAWQGYSLDMIADMSGIGFSTVAQIRGGRTARVSARFYTNIRDLCADIGMTIGTSTQARQCAERNRWAPLLAWDVDTIDDPEATPDVGVSMATCAVSKAAKGS